MKMLLYYIFENYLGWDTIFWVNLIEDLEVIKKFTCGLELTYFFIEYFSSKSTAELSIFYNEKWVYK